ncbi:MAG: hypothetical protein AAF632_28060, partial [Bacteroidota bacterium]
VSIIFLAMKIKLRSWVNETIMAIKSRIRNHFRENGIEKIAEYTEVFLEIFLFATALYLVLENPLEPLDGLIKTIGTGIVSYVIRQTDYYKSFAKWFTYGIANSFANCDNILKIILGSNYISGLWDIEFYDEKGRKIIICDSTVEQRIENKRSYANVKCYRYRRDKEGLLKLDRMVLHQDVRVFKNGKINFKTKDENGEDFGEIRIVKLKNGEIILEGFIVINGTIYSFLGRRPVKAKKPSLSTVIINAIIDLLIFIKKRNYKNS